MSSPRHTPCIRLRLRPGSDPSARLRLPAPVSLDLTIRRDWLDETTLTRMGRGGTRVRLSDADLRFPCPPAPSSSLSAFGVRWVLDHRAIPMNVSINAWVVIEEIDDPAGPVTWVRGRLESGSVRVYGLDHPPGVLVAVDRDGCPLDEPFGQVWPAALGPVAGVIVGHAAVQLDVIEADHRGRHRRRVAPVGVSDDGSWRFWRMTFCPADRADPPLERPADRVARKLAALAEATADGRAAVRVLPDPDPEDVDVAYVVRIDTETGLALPEDPGAPRDCRTRELIRPGVTLVVTGLTGRVTAWRPASLAVEKDLVTFTDRDELTHVARTHGCAETPAPPRDVILTWSAAEGNLAAAPRLTALPPLGFAGPDGSRSPGVGSAVWHLADLDVTGAFPNGDSRVQLSAAWVRLRMDASVRTGVVGVSVRRLPGWSGELVLEGYAEAGAGPWRLSIDVPDAFAPEGRALSPPRVVSEFRLTEAGLTHVRLELTDARVAAVTPPVELYDAAPLSDAEGVPHWPPTSPESVLRSAGLVFRDARPGGLALRAHRTDDGTALRLDCSPDCPPGTALVFVPAHRAFIDPSSPGLANVPPGERDQSHGLIPVALLPTHASPSLRVPPGGGRAAWGGSCAPVGEPPTAAGRDSLALALLPWTAGSPRPLGAPPADDEPIAVHHRNLVLEPAEFSAAAGDRAPAGRDPARVIPRESVVRAVRDRYTLATANARDSGRLTNWLDGVRLERDGAAADLRLLIPPESGFPFDLPEVRLLAGADDTGQTLSLATRCRFLAFGVAWQAGTGVQPPPNGGPSSAIPPAVTLTDPNGAGDALNSSIPLLFEDGVLSTRASLDNLGVVRSRSASEAGGWQVVERIRGDKLYLAVTYHRPSGPPLVRLGTPAGGDLTEIDFACDGLLLERDPAGGPDAFHPADHGAPLSLGSWWAFSTVEGPLEGLSRWPCLVGAPFYALEVVRLVIRAEPDGDSTRYTPTAIILRGVLPNPSELTGAALQGPPTKSPPAPVLAAAAGERVLEFSIAVGATSAPPLEVSGEFDWPFEVSRQLRTLSPVPGRLARLSGTVAYDCTTNRLTLFPDSAGSLATAFDRNWRLDGPPPPITAHATFDGAGRRTRFAFTAAVPAELTVTLGEDPVPPEFDLAVELATAVAGEFRLQARVSSVAGLLLRVQFLDTDGGDSGQPVVAVPSLEQGLYSAFLLGPGTDPDLPGPGSDVLLLPMLASPDDMPEQGAALFIVAAVSATLHFRVFDGGGVIILDTNETELGLRAGLIAELREQLEPLWPPHDLTQGEKEALRVAVATIVGRPSGAAVLALWAEGTLETPHLGAVMVRESHEGDRHATLDTLGLSGPCVALEVLATGLGEHDIPVWRRSEYVTWRLRPAGSSPAFELLLIDQYLRDDSDAPAEDPAPPVAAWLSLTDVPAAGPIRLHPTLAGGRVLFVPEDSWHLATPTVLLTPADPPPNEVLTLPGGPSLRAAAFDTLSGTDAEAVRLTFTRGAFAVERLGPDEVPLDACLDGDAARSPLSPGRRVPQVAMAGDDTDALRLVFPPTDRPFPPAHLRQPEPVGPLPALPAPAELWVLALLVQVQDRLVARRPLALPVTTAAPGPQRVENALVAIRPQRAGAVAPPIPPDPDSPPPGFPDPAAPLVGLLSASGTIADTPLMTENRIRTLLERTGSAGLAVRRVLLGDGGPARFQVVRSPFYDRQESESAGRSPLTFQPFAVVTVLTAAPSTDDQRRHPPAETAWLRLAGNLAYVPDPAQSGGSAPCEAARSARLIHLGGQPADADARPRRVFLREATAFETMAPLPFFPEDTPGDAEHTFLPRAIEFLWAPDKPGGMIHHGIQPRTKGDDDTTALGGFSDWAQRDPQRFKPPAGAAVTITRSTFDAVPGVNGLLRADLDWDDVLGTVVLDDSTATAPIRLADTLRLRLSNGGGYLLETDPPRSVALRLITVIDQEVVEVGRDDAAFPVLTGRPPKVYLVSGFPGLTDPLTAPDGVDFRPFVVINLEDPGTEIIKSLGDLFEPPTTLEGLTLWALRQDVLTASECERLASFGLVWKRNETDTDPPVPLFSSGNLKVVKRLTPSPVAPQVAVVVATGGGRSAPFQRTLTFGPSASTDDGIAGIVRDGNRRLFRFSVQDAAQAVTPSPATLGDRKQLTLVKYLTDGQTLFHVHSL